jgi:hypothetical protein
MTSEAEATKKIIDEIYEIRTQIYKETKNLKGAEFVAYFNNNAQSIIEHNGYKMVPLKDGIGYKIQK